MSVETDIVAALTGLVSGRVFPDTAPLNGARPFITYQQVGGVAVAFLENPLPSKKNGRFQINSWATTRIESRELAKQTEAAMSLASAFQARAVADVVAIHNPDFGLYGSSQDFTVWSDR
jgi:hypothetical protein